MNIEAPLTVYKKMGGRTLYVFIAKYANLILLTLVLGGLAIYGLRFLPTNFQSFAPYVNYGVIGLGSLVILSSILVGYLEYAHYRIEIYGDFLKIMRGIYVVEEVGVPYKRIVEIKVHRSLIEHMFGLANIRIVVFREDDKRTRENESIITLPALTKEVATKIQHNILERTNIADISTDEPATTS